MGKLYKRVQVKSLFLSSLDSLLFTALTSWYSGFRISTPSDVVITSTSLPKLYKSLISLGIAEESRTIIAEEIPFWTKFSFGVWNTYSIPALRRKIYPQKLSFLGSREVSRDDF